MSIRKDRLKLTEHLVMYIIKLEIITDKGRASPCISAMGRGGLSKNPDGEKGGGSSMLKMATLISACGFALGYLCFAGTFWNGAPWLDGVRAFGTAAGPSMGVAAVLGTLGLLYLERSGAR